MSEPAQTLAPDPSAYRVRARGVRWLTALGCALVLLAGNAAGSYLTLRAPAGAESTAALPGQFAHPGRARGADHPDRVALQRLLDRRAAAVRDHDRAAFLATVDPEAGPASTEQALRFERQRAVEFGQAEYTAGDALPEELDRAALGRPLPERALRLDVDFQYRLAHVDERAVGSTVRLVLVRRAGGWFVRSEQSAPPAGGTAQLWDFGEVRAVRGERSLVLGLSSVATLRRYAAEMDAAFPGVEAVWGTAWSRRVVLVVPRTQREMAALLGGRDGEYGQIAAVTTGEFNPGDQSVADRVTLNPQAFRGLGAVGRSVVLRHELTHVATRTATRTWTPMWLTEGFADYVGYRGSGVSPRVGAADLLARVRAGSGPSELPTAGAFRATDSQLSQAYEQAWLAARFIAERHGQAALARFYRTVGATPDGERRAFATVLGTTREKFTADWLAHLEELA